VRESGQNETRQVSRWAALHRVKGKWTPSYAPFGRMNRLAHQIFLVRAGRPEAIAAGVRRPASINWRDGGMNRRSPVRLRQREARGPIHRTDAIHGPRFPDHACSLTR
jgi:hypothetical protein